MKINVTVDLSQMFASEFVEISGSGCEAELRDDSSFMEAIKYTIKSEVTQTVLKEWRKEIGDSFSAEIVAAVRTLQHGFMEATLQSLLIEPGVKKSYYGDEMVSLREYIKECIASDFEKRGIDAKIQTSVNTLADSMSKGLANRYDSAFATRIVEKLHERKMLKDDVAALLLAAPEA